MGVCVCVHTVMSWPWANKKFHRTECFCDWICSFARTAIKQGRFAAICLLEIGHRPTPTLQYVLSQGRRWASTSAFINYRVHRSLTRESSCRSSLADPPLWSFSTTPIVFLKMLGILSTAKDIVSTRQGGPLKTLGGASQNLMPYTCANQHE